MGPLFIHIMKRVAIIMAGGAGERFWPLSRRSHPKQILKLSSPEKTMLEEAVERITPIVGIENVFIATAPHLVAPIAGASAGVPTDNILAEPAKRNTAGALAWATACLLARFGEEPLSLSIITADHRISPDEGFQATVRSAVSVAESTSGLATIGITPTRPETGYGYVEVGEVTASPEVPVHRVKSFREKPQADVAVEYLRSGKFLWNSGMFFWTVAGFLEALDAASPEHAAFIYQATPLMVSGQWEEAALLFEGLSNISIDFALMEKAQRVYVAEAAFEWDDLGSWDSLERVRELDELANVRDGACEIIECRGNVIVNRSHSHKVFALGVDDLIIVVTDGVIMVCPKERAQDVRALAALE